MYFFYPSFVGSIGKIDGCPKTQKIVREQAYQFYRSSRMGQVYTGVAADCMYVSKTGDQQAASQKILTTWNSASALYKVILLPHIHRGSAMLKVIS